MIEDANLDYLVDRIETRVAGRGRLEISGFPDPVSALLVSIPDGGEPVLNRLFLRKGRLPDPERHDEVVLSEAAAEAHGLRPGDAMEAVIEGKRRTLVVAGVGISPEYVYLAPMGRKSARTMSGWGGELVLRSHLTNDRLS